MPSVTERQFWIDYLSSEVRKKAEAIRIAHHDEIKVFEKSAQDLLVHELGVAELYQNWIAAKQAHSDARAALTEAHDALADAVGARRENGSWNKPSLDDRLQSLSADVVKNCIGMTDWGVEINRLEEAAKQVEVRLMLAQTDKVLRKAVFELAAMCGVELPDVSE